MFPMPDNKWARLLAYVTGLVNQKLLLQNEYLAAENRILRAHLPARMRLSDPERSTLAEIGKRLGRAALQQVACVAKPDTILAWYRRLIARKFDGSKLRTSPGRPPSHPKWKRSLCASPERTPAGDTTASSEPWQISATLFPIKRWETSSGDTGSSRHPSGARTQPGRISSALTWPSWQVPTSSQSKCSPGDVSPPTTCCSSFIWKPAVSVSPV
jgi:hypothetical protein